MSTKYFPDEYNINGIVDSAKRNKLTSLFKQGQPCTTKKQDKDEILTELKVGDKPYGVLPYLLQTTKKESLNKDKLCNSIKAILQTPEAKPYIDDNAASFSEDSLLDICKTVTTEGNPLKDIPSKENPYLTPGMCKKKNKKDIMDGLKKLLAPQEYDIPVSQDDEQGAAVPVSIEPPKKRAYNKKPVAVASNPVAVASNPVVIDLTEPEVELPYRPATPDYPPPYRPATPDYPPPYRPATPDYPPPYRPATPDYPPPASPSYPPPSPSYPPPSPSYPPPLVDENDSECLDTSNDVPPFDIRTIGSSEQRILGQLPKRWYEDASLDDPSLALSVAVDQDFLQTLTDPNNDYAVRHGFLMNSPIHPSEFRLYTIQRDGNCLFYCMAGHCNAVHLRGRTDWTQAEIRNELYMFYDTWDDSFFEGYTDGKSKQEYREYMVHDTNWGSTLDVIAFAIHFQINVLEYSTNNRDGQPYYYNNDMTPGQDIATTQHECTNLVPPMYLYNEDNRHYDLFVLQQGIDHKIGIPTLCVPLRNSQVTYQPFPVMLTDDDNTRIIKHMISRNKTRYVMDRNAIELAEEEIAIERVEKEIARKRAEEIAKKRVEEENARKSEVLSSNLSFPVRSPETRVRGFSEQSNELAQRRSNVTTIPSSIFVPHTIWKQTTQPSGPELITKLKNIIMKAAGTLGK